MLPFVYEFHWSVFHIAFLLIFFSVFVTVTTTVILALRRTDKAEQEQRVNSILWHTDFEELPNGQKRCRHELNGTVQYRTCDNGFDCSTCVMHPTLSQKNTRPGIVGFETHGFSMSPYRFYHRGHTWVQRENDGTFTIGIDDFGRRIIGGEPQVELPPVGTKLTLNGPAFAVKRKGMDLTMRSPITGEVTEHGGAEQGWYLRVRAERPELVTVPLLSADEVPQWIVKEMERLQASLATGGIGVTLADGGELSHDFHRHYPNADWDGIVGQMFLQM